MTRETLKELIEVAAGRKAADLVIKNGRIADVCSGEIFEEDLAIHKGYIAGFGKYEGVKVLDAKGGYLAPGLIDAHIHIESSYVTPEEFAGLVIPHGTTTVIADPHEIVNVCGLEGFSYMQRAAKRSKLSVKLMMPSCVPATPLEDAGAVILAEDMKEKLGDADVPGLGEFMDYMSVINAEDAAIEKLMLAGEYKKIVDGHSPGLGGKNLNAYVCGGIKTDHECSGVDEMKDRIRRGMYVQLREGSACHNLEALAAGVTKMNFRQCLICSDDKQPKTIYEYGHLEHHLKMLVKAGVDPLMGLAMATSNVAQCYHLDDRGMIAPGKRADIVIFEDLEDFKVREVLIEGNIVAREGEYLFETEREDISKVSNTVNIPDIRAEDFRVHLKKNVVNVIEMIPGEVLSGKTTSRVEVGEDGDFVFSGDIDIVKCAVIERHKKTGKIGLGFIKGYGMKAGAVAATVAHDSHNIICVGVNNEEMSRAVNEIKRMGGGFVLVKDGKVIESLALKVAGLMSESKADIVSEKLTKLHRTAVEELGVNRELEPVMTLTFMSLIVIPELKITARGMYDVIGHEFIGLEAEDGKGD